MQSHVVVTLLLVLSVPACSSGGSGTGGSDGGASTSPTTYDPIGRAFCSWLTGCGRDATGCTKDLASPALGTCAAAQTFYDAHRAELQACVNAKPACGSDDLKAFCAPFGQSDWSTVVSTCK